MTCSLKNMLLVAGFLVARNAPAQQFTHLPNGCAFSHAETDTVPVLMAPSGETDLIVKDILQALGLSANFTLRASNVANAQASLANGQRYILYNPAFLETLKIQGYGRWAAYTILAHEIGHHLNYHDFAERDIAKRKIYEINADQFAGSVMRLLGATMTEAQSALNILPEAEAGFYPKRSARMAGVAQGWQERDEWMAQTFGAGLTQREDGPRLDMATATAIMDRAIKNQDGSNQGQVKALEYLLKNGFNYENAVLDGLSLEKAGIPGANFTNASLIDANLSGIILNGGTLDATNLNFANLQRAALQNVHAEKAFFQFIYADSVDFTQAKLRESSFFLSRLRHAKFRNADLRGVCLSYCDLTGADFSGADLTDAVFYASVLNQATFNGAIISNTDVSIAVADSMTITGEQRAGLSKGHPLMRFLDINIYGSAQHTNDWDTNYPDYNTYGKSINQIPETMSKTLKFRTKPSYTPVGLFKNYAFNSSSDLRLYLWFDAAFWRKGNRGNRLKNRLDEYGAFLLDEIRRQKLIEGNSNEPMEWITKIQENARRVTYSDPLPWTKDAFTTLLLAGKWTQPENIQWENMATTRCEQDIKASENVRPGGWAQLYPSDVVCKFLPPQHAELYKKWTLARIKKMNVRQIEVQYTIRLSDINLLKRQESRNDTTTEKILLFGSRVNKGRPLHPSMKLDNWSDETTDNFLGLPKREAAYFKLPAARGQYFVEMNEKEVLAKGKRSAFVNVWITFELLGINCYRDTEDYEFAVNPKSVKLELDGQLIWQGSILELPSGK